jgi:hypothetical protein
VIGSAREGTSGGSGRPDGELPPVTVRAAGGLVGLEALALLGYAVSEVVRLRSAALDTGSVLAQAGFFVLVGLVLLGVGFGLWRGRSWARTPAIVVHLLLLFLAYSMLVPWHIVGLGAVVAVVALAGFGLLLCPPSREWAAEQDEARRRD